MTFIKAVSIFFLSMLIISNPALAEGKKLKEKLSKGTFGVTAEVKGCDVDMNVFCPGLDPESNKVIMCMMAYEDKLSKNCRVGLAEAAMSVKMGLTAIEYSVKSCEQDADKYCLNVNPGKGKIIQCLKKNKAKVSQSCVAALKKTGLWNMGAK